MEKKEVFHLISNTHWDREWYQSHEKYLVRLVRLCDRLVALLEREERYRFVLDGQFAMIGDYLEAKPGMRPRVERLVREGRLLPGPWYTQPLENLVGGEGLIRNLQAGVRESERLGGAMRFSYEVDEFGHTSQLPQILKGFGITDVMAWRGMPKEARSCFLWEGADGTTVHMFYTNDGYGEATALPLEEEDFDETIDGVVFHRAGLRSRVEALRKLRDYKTDSVHRLWLNGIDHSFAEEELFAVIEKLNALYPEAEAKQSTPMEYADAVKKDYGERGLQPLRVRGELLYTRESILESTNALHPREKKRHYESERFLVRRLEPMAAAAWLFGAEHPDWALTRAWRYLLENHAHDSLGCSSVDEVFEQVMARYGAAMSLAEQCAEGSFRYLASLGEEEPSVWILNLSSDARGGVVRLDLQIPRGFGDENFALLDAGGREIPHAILDSAATGDVRYNPRRGHPTWGEKTDVRLLAELPEIPGGGWLRLRLAPRKKAKGLQNRRYAYFAAEPGVLDNGLLRIRLNPNGTFDLTDLPEGRTYPGQFLLEDAGEAGSVYIHIPPEKEPGVITSVAASAESGLLYDTPLGAAMKVAVTISVPDGISGDRTRRSEEKKPLRVTAVIGLRKGAREADLSLTVENRSRNHRLRVLFPTYLSDAEESFGGQAFDTVFRPIRVPYDPDLPEEQAYATFPMQDYAGVVSPSGGLAAAARGIFEYEVIDDRARALALTLLRANDAIDTAVFARTPEYRMNEAQNLVPIDYDLMLIPGKRKVPALIRAASGLTNPLFAAVGRAPEESVMPDYRKPEKRLPDRGSLFTLLGEGLRVTAFYKVPEKEALVVRILNTEEEERQGRLSLALPGDFEVFEATLEEKKIKSLGRTGEISFALRGKGLLTLYLEKC